MRIRVCHLRHPIGLVWLSFDDDFFFLTTVQHCDSGPMTVCYINVWGSFICWFHWFFLLTISYGIVELRSSRCAMSRLNHMRSMCSCLHRFPDRGFSLSFCLLVAGALACENLMDRRHYVSRVWRLLLVVCAFVVQGFLMLSGAWTYSNWHRPNIRV